ncbi:MarR family winged helix-turn-helix transcriptional regulator [Sphingomonas endolithica]|uniref:MarR family winged helix-turn-helix transcriptional regulator n=1 Tax=Sphingomonas endolithica TaxID=2972485 RepID=UPI0021AE81F2|nr:MarR family transcriptional regulator [Sphingomonas sp. ZFBP2030]
MTAAPDSDVADLLRAAAGAAHQALSRAVLPHGVTAAEWTLMRELRAAGAVSQTRLADRLGMTRGAISKLVDRLVAKRLLVRGRGGGGDRRVQIIGLTGAGALLVPKLAVVTSAVEAALFADLPLDERGTLAAALKRVAGGAIED